MVPGGCLQPGLSEYDIEYRVHATRRMFERGIHEEDVELKLARGIIVEQYDEDFPLPSLLLNGQTGDGRAIHVVVAVNDSERKLVIITAYVPDPLKWTEGFSRRVQ